MARALAQTAPRPGFAMPVFDAQASFRTLLDAMARPGIVREIRLELAPPPGVDLASAALLLALLDHDTPLWLGLGEGDTEAGRFFAFHCGCPIANDPALAGFALGTPGSASIERFPAGTAERPDLSATIILQLPALVGGEPIRLSGPGIAEVAVIEPRGLSDNWRQQLHDNAALFPRGRDVVLVSGGSLCALPRTTRLEI